MKDGSFISSREQSTHRARKIQRGKGVNSEEESREEVSLDVGRCPGGGVQQAVKVGLRVQGRGLSWKHRLASLPRSGDRRSDVEMALSHHRRML